MQKIALGLIHGYQFLLSPFFAPCCRYFPSCSEYAHEAIERYGFFKGGYLAGRRILRCHPLCEGGHDPVPSIRD